MSKPRPAGKDVAVKLANKLKSKGKFHKSKPQVKRLGNASKGLKRVNRAAKRITPNGRQNGVLQRPVKRKVEHSGDESSDGESDVDAHSCEKKIRSGFDLQGDEVVDVEEDAPDDATSVSDPVTQVTVNRAATPQLSLIEIIAGKRRAVQECKLMVGNECVAVISNPEKNLKRLKPLLSLMDFRKDDPVFKLAFLQQQSLIAYSLLEVFKDILPSYKIKENTADDVVNKKLKKETRELREFETTLLSYYRTYISKLQRMVECVKKRKVSNFYDQALSNFAAKEKIATVGTRCLCMLMVSHPFFNFTPQIIETVVPVLSSRSQCLRELSFEYVTRLFREDKTGHVSLPAVKSAGKVIKAYKLNVHPLVIQSFLHLKIKEVRRSDDSLDMKVVREQNRKQSRMERKHNKDMLKLKNELKEVDAREDQEKKVAIHTQILNQIFFVYFRFIKDFIELADNDFAKNSAVMSPVLEGLSKFAHLINIDFFDDLIALLYRLIVSQRLSHLQALYCLNTVFTILSGEGSVLSVDPQRFYARFYASLTNFDVENDGDSYVSILIDCFDKMLLKRKKQLTRARVLAFCKRTASLSLQTSSETSAVYLSLLRSLLQDHPKADLLMDTEHFGSGSFQPLLDDPEYCNANATRLWELHSLRHHFDPYVSRLACNHIQRMTQSKVKADFFVKGANQVFVEIADMNRVESVFSEKSAAKVASVKRKNNARNRLTDDVSGVSALLSQMQRSD